jgi:hypothetical protein
MTKAQFVQLLDSLGHAWTRRNYEAAASVFATDVHYSDPKRYSLSTRAALLEFFRNDDGCEQKINWHRLLFDEEAQSGVAEYTYEGTHRYHGAVLIELQDDLIASWREYQHVDHRDWDAFIKGEQLPG